MSFINKIVTGALLTGSALGFSGCNTDGKRLAEQRQEVIKELLVDRPVREYNQAVAGWRNGSVITADAQSTIDSIAYRQVFDGTVAAQDSAKVKEFNSIAAKMKVSSDRLSFSDAFNELDNKMINMDITKRAMDANAEEYKSFKRRVSTGITGHVTHEHPEKVLAVRQFKADSMAYNKFFKDNNLLTPETAEKLTKVAKKVKLRP